MATHLYPQFFSNSIQQIVLLLVFSAMVLPNIARATQEAKSTISLIDMDKFRNPATQKEFVRELSEAFQKTGFVAIQNHGVNLETLNKAYKSAEQFYVLPYEEKMKLYDRKHGGQRGYTPGETAVISSKPDFKEFFSIGRQYSDEQRKKLGYAPNTWPPEETFDLKSPMVTLFKEIDKFNLEFQVALAKAVGQPDDFFVNMIREGDVIHRIIHYFPNPPKNTDWAAEHTDIGLFTIVPRSTERGLQLQNQEGEWIYVEVPENTFIVNVGDMLQNITNGLFRSGPHRVLANREGKERYSMVFYVHPRPTDRLDPLPYCIEQTGGKKKFPDSTQKELLLERLVDLGIGDREMVQFVGNSGIEDRLIEVGRGSPRVMRHLRDHNAASERVLSELRKLEGKPNP